MSALRHAFILGLVLGILPCGAALANSAPPRTITISGQGAAAGVPDTVRISAGVSVRAETAAGALRADSAQMNRVFAALKAMGVPDRAIQTSQFSVSPQYTGGNNTPQRLTGYEVTNQVTVILDDVSKLGTALDTLVAAGANQINDVDFSIRDSAPLLAQARTAAVADAIAKAQIYAKAAGVALGPILSISEGDGEVPGMAGMLMARANAHTPVAAGEQKLNASVTITWEIH